MSHWARRLASAILLLVLISPVFSSFNAGAEIPGYPDYQQISEKLQYLNGTYPKICALHSLGTTYEGRTIWALKISDNAWKEENEPEVLIMGGHHAKELISVEVPLMFAEFLAENYSSNMTVRNIVDSNEIWIVPVVNPDGYEYAWEGHTGWRKNRRPIDANGDGIIDGIGVDLNRNYGHLWGKQGASHDPNSDIYCGPHPFSENETKAIRALALSHNFTFSVSFHSYGKIIYHPWGNSLDPEPMDNELMEAIGNEMAEYNNYTVIEGKDTYVTTGDSDDWLYANTTCLPFTIELGKEFIPPPDEIQGIFEKNRDALVYLLSISGDPYLAVSEKRTNLRITHFSISDGVANISVENQGNYSVSALLTLSSGSGPPESERFALKAHEKMNFALRVNGSGEFEAKISALHHAKEWNTKDNTAFASFETDEGKLRTEGTDALMYVFGTVILLFFLFAYVYKSLKKD